MKIAYCLPDTYSPGGIERVVSIKVNYLANVLGYDVTIITTGQLNKPSYYAFSPKIKMIDLGINYIECRYFPFYKRFFVRAQKKSSHKQKLTQLLQAESYDIVVSTFTHEVSFLSGIKDNSKKVLEFHFHKGFKKKYANAFKVSFFAKLGYWYATFMEEKFYIKRYDAFVALTKQDEAAWKKNIPNVTSIPNILPFYPSRRAELINKSIIAVGRLDAQKGFDKLIDLWSNVAIKYPDWKLNIYGNGVDEKMLNEKIAHNHLQEIVLLKGSDANIIDRYFESSIMIMTSRYEGMPMTLLEAMSCGLPAIVYDFECGPRDIVNNGEDGYMIAMDNEADLVEKVIKLIEDETLRQNMGLKAFENIKRYSTESVMKSWEELFNSLVSSSKYN